MGFQFADVDVHGGGILPRIVVRPILFTVLCAVAFAAAAAVPPRSLGLWRDAVGGSIAAIAALLLTWLFVRIDRIHMRNVGVAMTLRSLPRFAAGIAIGFALAAVWAVSLGGRRPLSHDVPGNLVMALTFFVLASREELAFHGYPLRRLNDRYGFWIAQVAMAILFGFEHKLAGWPWTNAFLGAAVGSILFGTAALTTGGLAVPIGMHAAWNFGLWTFGSQSKSGLTGTILYDIIIVAVVIVFMLWHRFKLSAHGEVGADGDRSGRT